MKNKRIDNGSLSGLFHDFSLLIAGGLTPMESAEMLSEDTPDPALKKALGEVTELLMDGESLSRAVRKTDGFPDYCADMLESAEAAGRMEEVGAALSRYYAQKVHMEKLVRSAITRPLVLLGLLCIVLTGFLMMVLPMLSGVYDSLAGNAELYMTGAYIISGTALGLLMVLLIASLSLWMLGRRGYCQKFIMGIWDNSRFTSGVSLLLARSAFAADMDVQLAGGLLIEEAMERALSHVRHRGFYEVAERCTRRISNGESVGTVLRTEHLMPPLATQRLFVGLRGGKLEEAATQVEQDLAEEAGAQTEQLIACIEPVLSGVFSLLLAFALLSVMLPLLGVIAGMGGAG